MYTCSDRILEMFIKEEERKEGRKRSNMLEFGHTCVVVLS